MESPSNFHAKGKVFSKSVDKQGNWFLMVQMSTFIKKTKFKITEDQTNIDKYKLAANITEYHIMSILIIQQIIITNFCDPVSHLR